MRGLRLAARSSILDLLSSLPHPPPEAPRRRAPLPPLTLPSFFLAGLGHSQEKSDRYADQIAQTDPRKPEEEKKAFRLPEGFEAQLAPCEPDIHKPMNLAFDD